MVFKNGLINLALVCCLSLLMTQQGELMAQQGEISRNVKQGGPQGAQSHRSGPLRRKDSFFGLHFDFHATLADENIGRTLSYGMIDSLLNEVPVDFIQVDCKGHPGISSYPTKVGTPAKSFDKDPLRLWREVTRKHGVALYVHYSGVFDKQAVKLHPEWAAVNAADKIDTDKISVFGRYADDLLIPQFKELSRDYGVDGVWVDGDCWAVVPDYSPAAIKAFQAEMGMAERGMTEKSIAEGRAETGKAMVPRSSKDTGYARFLDFNRRAFLNYVQHYVSAMHIFNPDFQVASNWSYSSFIPEPVATDVDFLSGDLTPVNSLNNAAFEGRCLASQSQASGRPWDIMSWGFTLNWDRQGMQTKKSALQIEQEAAEIIAMGGGFQCYFTQNRDASIRPWQIPTMRDLGRFVQARKAFCKDATPIPQVAILYSGATHERETRQLFTNGGLERVKGITTALLDGQQAVEIKMEHHLHGSMRQYPLIIVPEWDWLVDSFRSELLAYVSDGGKLLVIGAEATRLFEKEAGVRLQGNVSEDKLQYLGYHHDMAAIQGDYQRAELLAGTRSFGGLYEGQDLRFAPSPAASIASYGKGQIACVFADMGEDYQRNTSSLQRDFINGLVRELFAEPMVSISGSHLVHVAINRLGKKTIVHLINTGGPHANKNIYSYDEIPPIGPLTVRIRMKKPAALWLQPENQLLPFHYEKGQAVVILPVLKIHSMIVAEEK